MEEQWQEWRSVDHAGECSLWTLGNWKEAITDARSGGIPDEEKMKRIGTC